MNLIFLALILGLFVLAAALLAKPLEGALRAWRHARRRAWWRRRRADEAAAFERQRLRRDKRTRR